MIHYVHIRFLPNQIIGRIQQSDKTNKNKTLWTKANIEIKNVNNILEVGVSCIVVRLLLCNEHFCVCTVCPVKYKVEKSY